MDVDGLTVVHDVNTIERAMKILKDSKAILSNVETGEDNDWGESNEICVAAYDYHELIYHYRKWGHIRFVIKEEWIGKNKEQIRHHQFYGMGIDVHRERLCKPFIRKYGFKQYRGPMEEAVNQLIVNIPIPLKAIEAIIIYGRHRGSDADPSEVQLLKDNKPKNVPLYIVEGNQLKQVT